MRMLLIDPFEMTVTALDEPSGLQTLYRLIDCRTVTPGPIDCPGSTLWVDDEGLFAEQKAFWTIEGLTLQPLTGKGVLVGFDANTGEDRDCTQALSDIERRVRWVEPMRLGGNVFWLDARTGRPVPVHV